MYSGSMYFKLNVFQEKEIQIAFQGSEARIDLKNASQLSIF